MADPDLEGLLTADLHKFGERMGVSIAPGAAKCLVPVFNALVPLVMDKAGLLAQEKRVSRITPQFIKGAVESHAMLHELRCTVHSTGHDHTFEPCVEQWRQEAAASRIADLRTREEESQPLSPVETIIWDGPRLDNQPLSQAELKAANACDPLQHREKPHLGLSFQRPLSSYFTLACDANCLVLVKLWLPRVTEEHLHMGLFMACRGGATEVWCCRRRVPAGGD